MSRLSLQRIGFKFNEPVFPGPKGPGCEAQHLSLSNVKAKSKWSYMSTPAPCLHILNLIIFHAVTILDYSSKDTVEL